MAQFTAYENKNKETQQRFPYLLNVQNDLLAPMQTCVVIPLCTASDMQHPPISKLMPKLTINGQEYFAITSQLAGIHQRELGNPAADLSSYRDEIISAIDFILSGF